MTQLHEIEQRAGILCASLALGFPYSDAEYLGANVLVYAWDEVQAADAADEMADFIWEKRFEFTPELTAVDAGVLEAMKSDRGISGRQCGARAETVLTEHSLCP